MSTKKKTPASKFTNQELVDAAHRGLPRRVALQELTACLTLNQRGAKHILPRMKSSCRTLSLFGVCVALMATGASAVPAEVPSLSVSNGTAVTEYECNRLSSTIRVNSADFLKSQEILLFRNSGRCSEKGRLVLWAEDPIDR